MDFVLIVLTGNLSRYLTLRPLVERDHTVTPKWYPVRTWVQGDWLRFLPGGARLRARHLLDSRKVFLRRPADAVIMHALDTYSVYGLWHRMFRLRTILVNNPDDVDFDDKHGLSRWLLQSAVERTALFVPWSVHAADHLTHVFPEVRDRIEVFHPGLPLEHWPLRPERTREGRFRILFVGGDAMRKGLDTLLDAFEQSLQDECELDVATQAAYLPDPVRDRLVSMAHATLHLDLQPGSAGLKSLFEHADVFVLPTRGDASSWVAIEALATGVPVIISPQGGIAEIVVDGSTGLHVPPEDPDAIVAAVNRLRGDRELSARLVRQGREHIEQHFNAAINSVRLIETVKRMIDARNRS